MDNILLSDSLFTVEEAAMYLSLSVQTIRKYIKKGDIKAIRLNNKCYRISQESMNDFLQERCM